MLTQFVNRDQTAQWEASLQKALGEPTFVPGQANAFCTSMNQAMRAGMAAFSMAPAKFVDLDRSFATAVILLLQGENVSTITVERMLEVLEEARNLLNAPQDEE